VAKPSRDAVLAALLERHGRTYCDELGIDIEKGTASPLFRWLCASLLFSARISAELAVQAAAALAEQGWTTPQKLADATWKERVRTLNASGYARFDERTATMLGETCEILLDRYGGDLRRLREEAERDLPRLVTALVRTELADDYDGVREAAAG
jgi:endonuclease III